MCTIAGFQRQNLFNLRFNDIISTVSSEVQVLEYSFFFFYNKCVFKIMLSIVHAV